MPDARSAIELTERARYFQRVRLLACDVANLWVERWEEESFSLLPKTAPQEKKNLSSPALVANFTATSMADFVFEIDVRAAR